jgi:hypothetical protein
MVRIWELTSSSIETLRNKINEQREEAAANQSDKDDVHNDDIGDAYAYGRGVADGDNGDNDEDGSSGSFVSARGKQSGIVWKESKTAKDVYGKNSGKQSKSMAVSPLQLIAEWRAHDAYIIAIEYILMDTENKVVNLFITMKRFNYIIMIIIYVPLNEGVPAREIDESSRR